MVRGRDIVLLSSTAWDALWEANHELATRLARAGNRVFYVEHMGFRAPRLRQVGRVFRYFQRWFRARRDLGRREVATDLHVSTPMVLPPHGGFLSRLVNRRLLLPLVARAARRIGIRDPIVITWVPTDTAVDLIELLVTPKSTVVAWWVADYQPITRNPKRLQKSEERLLRRADLVLAQGPGLAAHCARFSDRVQMIRPGVDLDAFPIRSSQDSETPPVLRNLRRPIIGYVGGLHATFDAALMRHCISRRPEWTWVFVGDLRVPDATLLPAPNVVLVGRQPHHTLIDFIERFDVCIVPYRCDASSEAVFPTKLQEYLAAGKRVVTTPLPLLRDYHHAHPYFTIADPTPAAFLHAIDDALHAPADRAAALQRRSAAALDDWNLRIEEIAAMIEAAEESRGGGPAPAAREEVTA